MKRIICLLLFIFLFANVLHAEKNFVSEKGVILTGSAGLTNNSSNGLLITETILTLSTNMNKILYGGFFIGGGMDIRYRFYGSVDENYSFGIGPNIGAFFTNTKGILYPYAIGGLRYYKLEQDIFGLQLNVGFGLLISITEQIGIDCSLNYAHFSVLNDNRSGTMDTFSLGFGICGLLF